MYLLCEKVSSIVPERVQTAQPQMKLSLEFEALLDKDVASDEDLGQCGLLHLLDGFARL